MKKKKKKKRRKRTCTGPSIEALEKKAIQCLGERKYRQARDHFKKLCNYDRDKYLPHLIEANKGLALKMIKGGKFGYAKTILDQMRFLGASGKDINPIEVALALHQEDYRGAVAAASDYLGKAEGEEPGNTRLAMYDALVLSFEPLEEESPLPDSIKEQVKAIQTALRLVSQELYNEAITALRSIGLRSPFSHWRLFLKGLCAFYQGEDEKAHKAFTGLPPESVPARAAHPYLVLLGGAEGLSGYRNKPDLLRLVCWIAGERDLEAVLPKAEYQWSIRRFSDSYLYLSKNLEGFPSEQPGIIQELTDFYLKAPFHMQERDADKYVASLDRFADRKHTHSLEKLMILKTLCLYYETILGHDLAVKNLWEEFLRIHRDVQGKDLDLEASVYAHLGDLFSTEEPSHDGPFFFARRRQKGSEVRNASLAEACYKESIRLNSGDRAAYLSLLDLYEKTGEKSKLNRKLDEFINLFPEDKDILYKAGLRCMGRKALVKGMNYLEKAVRLDPLDNDIRKAFIICCTEGALEYAKHHRMEKCRNLLPRALQWGETALDDFDRGHAYINVRWACMELLGGDPEQAEKLLDKGKSAANNDLKFHFFTLLVAKSYNVPLSRVKKIERIIGKEFSRTASPDKLVPLIETVSYFKQYPSRNGRWLRHEIGRVKRYVLSAVKAPVLREQARIAAQFALENGESDIASKYVNKVLRDNPDDAYFRYLRYQIKKRPWDSRSTKGTLRELEKILELAERERDQELIIKIRGEIDQIRCAEKYLGDFFGDDLEEDDYYDIDYRDEMPYNNCFNEVSDQPGPRKNPAREKRREAESQPPFEQLNLFDETGDLI